MAEPRPDRVLKPKRPGSAVDGTQSLRRAISILRLLAQNNDKGMSLTEAVRAGGLNKATTHRILSALVSEGLAAQDHDTRNYYLGFEMVALGIAATSRYGISQLARPHVARLAQELGDTAYLTVRSGDDAVCVLREVGSFPIKTLTFPPGARSPLGVGSGPLALLAFEPEAIRARLIQSTIERLSKTSRKLTEAELQQEIKLTRKNGYACMGDKIVPGMRAVALPVRHPDGTIAAALSVASIQPRLDGKRLQLAIKLLKRECADLEERLRTSQFKFDL